MDSLLDGVKQKMIGDDRLKELLLHAAYLVTVDLADFASVYAVNVECSTIVPDPITNSDTMFVGLMCYKAASMYLNSAAIGSSNSSFIIKDGPSTIDGREAGVRTKAMADKMSREYTKMIANYRLGGGMKGQAIVTPFHDRSWVSDDGRNR